jgi:hypothetical protein
MVYISHHIRHVSSFKNGVTFQSYYTKNKTSNYSGYLNTKNQMI